MTALDSGAAETGVRPTRFDALRAFMLLIHFGIIAYACWGWQQTTRIGLFVYILFLPLIVLQWLLNGGTSLVANWESMVRTGHWRDPHNPFEGHLFQKLFGIFGLRFTQAQINTMLVLTMSMFWLVAALRMVLIPT